MLYRSPADDQTSSRPDGAERPVPASRPTALAALARTAIDAATQASLPIDDLLARSKVSRAAIDELEGRIPVVDLLRLWSTAAEMSGDPFFGLHAGERVVSARTIHVVGYAASRSHTLCECYESTARYAALTNEASEIAVSHKPGRSVISVGPKPGLPMWPRVYAEMAIAAYLSLGRKWSGVAFPAVQATFQHAEPQDTTEYRRLFGDRLRFNARQNTLTLSSATFALPLGTTDPDLLSYLQTQATNLIEQGTGISLEHQVRAAIATVMAETAPTLERIARHLAMSPRTLQRRLAGGSLQFHVLADEVRRVTALRLASARDAEVAAIARQVGYRDPDTFRAAFLRWTGKTPRDYRREPS